MNRHTVSMLASAGVFLLVVGVAAEQTSPGAKPATPQASQASPAGQAATAKPRLVPPVRGEAPLGYTKPIVKAGKIDGKDFIITTIRVKNLATGSIAGLKVDEFWYDKAGDPVTGDTFRHPKPLQPGEVITVTLETPRNPKMDRNQYNFSHANGTIKAQLLPKL
jgi:hypothetical protein